jgi:hypothetical protein
MSAKLDSRIERLEKTFDPNDRDAEAARAVRQELLGHPELMDLLWEMERCDFTTGEKIADAARLRELKIQFNEKLKTVGWSEAASRMDLRFKIDPLPKARPAAEEKSEYG